LDVVCELLNHDNVDVNARNDYGNSALIRASLCGHVDVVCDFLNHDKVDVNARNTTDGNTSLIEAIRSCHVNFFSSFSKIKGWIWIQEI
jgi:ankyrin repeat protein